MIVLNTETNCSPVDAWSTFVSCNLHFSYEKDYDAFRFNFKGPRCKRETFIKMSQRYVFEKMAKRYPTRNDIILYSVSNIIQGNTWIGQTSDEVYEQWKGKIQALDYKFKSDMSNARDHIDDFDLLIKGEDPTQIPLIYRLYKSNAISLETLASLNVLLNFTSNLDKTLSDPLEISKRISHLTSKYSPFLKTKVNKKKCKDVIISLFTKQQN